MSWTSEILESIARTVETMDHSYSLQLGILFPPKISSGYAFRRTANIDYLHYSPGPIKNESAGQTKAPSRQKDALRESLPRPPALRSRRACYRSELLIRKSKCQDPGRALRFDESRNSALCARACSRKP